MSSGFDFDAATAQRIERVYETNDAARRRRAVLAALDLAPGEHVIDIGTGPGFVARERCDVVASSGRIFGVDTGTRFSGIRKTATECPEFWPRSASTARFPNQFVTRVSKLLFPRAGRDVR